MSKIFRNCCFRFSTILLAAGLQCYAYAGFAVNVNTGELSAIYESEVTTAVRMVSKQEAIDFYEKNKQKYAVVFAYNLLPKNASELTLDLTSPLDSFCINPYTRKIGVAVGAKDAKALTQTRPQVFYVVAGETLSDTVARWARENGCTSKWNSPNDFNIEYPYTFYGSFAQALDELLHSIAAASDGFAVKAKIMKRNCVVVVSPNEFNAKPVIT